MIYDEDRDFGSVDVIDTDQFQKSELVPSQRVDLMSLSHLSVEQRTKLLALLDKCSECFSENPDFFSVDQYKFDNFAVCKLPRLKVNLEDLKPLVEARLHELFRLSDKVGTPMKCVLGGRYRVCVKDQFSCRTKNPISELSVNLSFLVNPPL